MSPLPTEESGRPAESVWDYPRPPRLEQSRRRITVEFGGEVIAETDRALRILETSHPPTYYIPPEDVRMEFLERSKRSTFCEWKGHAAYYHVDVDGEHAENAAWTYPSPAPAFDDLTDYVAFYPGKMDRCTVDGEEVAAQEGGFYGGWITSDIEGPFKGG
ncbi:DUF427 domain-containing protein [Persicimonas caeni]|uniref:DUF427 domain-containing protein n=1 Tax=Persicimonas caeni TaxID=2292766 RepID=A0A4Y6PML8_PERCE|nr:DUF427 domain-containing protein [Persicimonas caeni]QDG49469.1 DUF427 domain-containing protein [Persicimonas caeni]QED30690.1 DUF427 domain-containing protein [Persicimonas caeni]